MSKMEKRKSSLFRKRSTRAKSESGHKPIIMEGFLYKDELPRRGRWYAIKGSYLIAMHRKPASDDDYHGSNVHEKVDLRNITQVKVEGSSIILEMKQGGLLKRTFSRRQTVEAWAYIAPTPGDALRWVQKMQEKGPFAGSRTFAGEKVSTPNEMYGAENIPTVVITKLMLKDRKRGKTYFQIKKPSGGGTVPVKYLLGSLPSEFRFAVEVEVDKMLTVGESPVYYKADISENDMDREAFDSKSTSINFDVGTNETTVKVYMELDRQDLATYELISFDKKLQKLGLEYLLLPVPKPVLGLGFFVVLVLISCIVLRPFEALLLSAPTAAGLYPYFPLLEEYLVDKMQPYFLSNISAKSQQELDAAKAHRLAQLENSKKDVSITSEEYVLLDELKNDLEPLYNHIDEDSYAYMILNKHIGTDYRLVRFLRARNNNMNKAAAMVKKSMEWRMSYQADNIISDNETVIPEWLLQYAGCPQVMNLMQNKVPPPECYDWFLRDKDTGNLAVLIRSGVINWRAVYKKLQALHKDDVEDVLFSYMIYVVEWGRLVLDSIHEETNGEVTSYITFIADLKGMKHSNQIPINKMVPLAKRFLPIFFTSYPELLHRVLIVNAPAIFYTLFSMIKPLIPQRILNKFIIRGSSDQLGSLSRVLAISDIPKSYGGELEVDGDPLCLEKIPAWGPFQQDKGEWLVSKPKKN